MGFWIASLLYLAFIVLPYRHPPPPLPLQLPQYSKYYQCPMHIVVFPNIGSIPTYTWFICSGSSFLANRIEKFCYPLRHCIVPPFWYYWGPPRGPCHPQGTLASTSLLLPTWARLLICQRQTSSSAFQPRSYWSDSTVLWVCLAVVTSGMLLMPNAHAPKNISSPRFYPMSSLCPHRTWACGSPFLHPLC